MEFTFFFIGVAFGLACIIVLEKVESRRGAGYEQ